MWRYAWYGKDTIDDYKSVDIRQFRSRWCFRSSGYMFWSLTRSRNWNQVGSMWYSKYLSDEQSYMVFDFTVTDRDSWEKTPYKHQINLAKTPCNYWWYRYWFVCPKCQKKYVSLYIGSNSGFYCRECLNLCYADQKIGSLWRLFNRIYPREYDADQLYKTIKYKFRNGNMTRKYKRYCKMTRRHVTMADVEVLSAFGR